MTPHSFPLGPFIGTCLVALAAAGWVAAGTRSLGGSWPAALSLLAALVSVGLAGRDYFLLCARTHAPFHFDGAAYGLSVAFESVAIPVAAALLTRRGKAEYLLAAIALIVGLHFFGLVRAFDSPACGWIGGAMCLLPLATVRCLPAWVPRRVGDGTIRLWDLVVGLGCAAILWLTLLIVFD